MTISKEQRATSILKGNGASVEFPFGFKVFNAQTDISVFRAESEDSFLEEQVSRSAYSVTLNSDQENNPGGVVVFTKAPASGTVFVIRSSIPNLQGTSLTNHDRFLPEVLNEVHDKLTAMVQQLAYLLGKCLTVPSTLDKTPQEVLSDILEVAAKANEYAQSAQEIYLSVSSDVAEIKALKSEIDELIVTFEQVSALVEEAQENKEATDDNLIACQQILAKVSDTALNSGFAIRTIASCTANETFPISNLNPSVNSKPGDLVFSASDCKLYQITSVTASHVTVGALVASLKGEKGDQGVQGLPGPAGEQGEQGPMGQSPYATCFGQFQVKPSGMLCLEVVGLAPATFTINDQGVVEATYDNS